MAWSQPPPSHFPGYQYASLCGADSWASVETRRGQRSVEEGGRSRVTLSVPPRCKYVPKGRMVRDGVEKRRAEGAGTASVAVLRLWTHGHKDSRRGPLAVEENAPILSARAAAH